MGCFFAMLVSLAQIPPECADNPTISAQTEQRSPILGRIGLLWSGSGGRIRTCDLRVMSPASYRTAPPRVGETNFKRRAALKANNEGVPLLTAR